MTFVITWTGRKLVLDAPKKEDISIVDIARGVANECRYGNQCHFYSVAEHSVLLSRYFSTLRNPGRLPLLALLHDASEAYLGDVPSVRKEGLSAYLSTEQSLQAAILDALEVDPPTDRESALVKDADLRIRLDERDVIAPRIEYLGSPELLTPLGVRIYKWLPSRAEEEFLTLFSALTGLEGCVGI
jgi:5'-deoxynucleotidase YfbR-like HD superfamily hydrolase